MENPEIVLEKLLKKWRDIRKSYGKIYSMDRIYLSRFIKNNGNKGICNNIFNFSVESNRCVSCSELCMLTDNGEPCEEEINLSNMKLVTKHFPIYEEEIIFSQFNNKKQKENIPKFSTFSTKTKNYTMANFEKISGKFKNPTTHRIIIMSVMETYNIEIPLMAAYFCDNLTIVEKKQNETRNIELHLVLKILLSIVRKIIHGRESREFIKIFRENKIVKVEITACEETSVKLEKDKQNYFIPSESFDENYSGTFPVDIVLMKRPEDYNVAINFPIMERYRNLFVYGLRFTENLFDYYKYTCDNVFPEFRFYLWMIALMSDSDYYPNFTDEFFDVLFFEEDKIKIKLEIPLLHSKQKVTYEDIKEFCIRTQIRMKLNCRDLVEKFMKSKDRMEHIRH